jgi:hypothetical protein
MAQQPQLGNQWLRVFRTGNYDGKTYTSADLDEMIAEYEKRQDAEKATVGLGVASEQKPEVLGKIDALRRVGDSVEGKFSGIDPWVEHLYNQGVFSKRSVHVKRSPEGLSLQRVGLIHPTFRNGGWHDEGTPSLDDLMQAHSKPTDVIFGEKMTTTSEHRFVAPEARFQSGSRAGDAIAQMKASGNWIGDFDHFQFPLMFAELDGTTLDNVVSFLERLMKECDPGSALLSKRAQYWAYTHNVSFGEGLSQVLQLSPTGDRLTDAANARKTEKNITFGDALFQVAEEHPELTQPRGR